MECDWLQMGAAPTWLSGFVWRAGCCARESSALSCQCPLSPSFYQCLKVSQAMRKCKLSLLCRSAAIFIDGIQNFSDHTCARRLRQRVLRIRIPSGARLSWLMLRTHRTLNSKSRCGIFFFKSLLLCPSRESLMFATHTSTLCIEPYRRTPHLHCMNLLSTLWYSYYHTKLLWSRENVKDRRPTHLNTSVATLSSST
jgi:hypothetical protein